MMRVIADLCLIPIGVGVSVSREIATCERVLAEAGLKTKLHAYGTNIEGEWDEVFAAIKRCHEVVHAMGTPVHRGFHQPFDLERELIVRRVWTTKFEA